MHEVLELSPYWSASHGGIFHHVSGSSSTSNILPVKCSNVEYVDSCFFVTQDCYILFGPYHVLCVTRVCNNVFVVVFPFFYFAINSLPHKTSWVIFWLIFLPSSSWFFVVVVVCFKTSTIIMSIISVMIDHIFLTVFSYEINSRCYLYPDISEGYLFWNFLISDIWCLVIIFPASCTCSFVMDLLV